MVANGNLVFDCRTLTRRAKQKLVQMLLDEGYRAGQSIAVLRTGSFNWMIAWTAIGLQPVFGKPTMPNAKHVHHDELRFLEE